MLRVKNGMSAAGLLLFSVAVRADGVIANLLAFEEGIHDLVKAISIMTGVGLLVAALLRYQRYRRREQGVQMHHVVWLAIFGLVMVGIGYLPPINFDA